MASTMPQNPLHQRLHRIVALVFGWRSVYRISYLFLGGAAVYRCDKQLVFSAGFTDCWRTQFRIRASL